MLVDTSVWVAHLKHPAGDPGLIRAIGANVAHVHPFVEGELLLADAPVGQLLSGMPVVRPSLHHEVVDFLSGLPVPPRGVGWVDAHLLHSALVHRLSLFTYDRALQRAYDDCRE